jgi:hypothetical protein
MTLLSALKLIVSTPGTALTPAVKRRHKLIAKLNEQLQLATANAEGRTFAPTKLRKVLDVESGEKRTVEVPKRVKPWWWTGANGKLHLSVRYGARIVDLKKGLNAVELADKAQLVPTLVMVRDAVEAGELDAAIEAAAKSVKRNFR